MSSGETFHSQRHAIFALFSKTILRGLPQSNKWQVSFGDSLETGWCDGAPAREKAVAVFSYFETGPESGLAEAEAIKLFSLFYNEEAKANEIFREIEVGVFVHTKIAHCLW